MDAQKDKLRDLAQSFNTYQEKNGVNRLLPNIKIIDRATMMHVLE